MFNTIHNILARTPVQNNLRWLDVRREAGAAEAGEPAEPGRKGGTHDFQAERFLKVFRGEMPDRVPVTLFLADQGHFLNQMYPDVDPWDFDTPAAEGGRDPATGSGWTCSCACCTASTTRSRSSTGAWTSRRAPTPGRCAWRRSGTSNTLIERATIRTPDGTLTQDFSDQRESGPGTFMYACTKQPIESPKDLDIGPQVRAEDAAGLAGAGEGPGAAR